MFISPKYTLSGRLYVAFYCCFGAIFLSVNMAERPFFEKEMFALINACSH